MVNYTKSIIYKLCCKNPEIKEIYVGSTTNFIKRKYKHKSACNNVKDKDYNYNIYKYIRENGGFSNWDMIEIEKHSCNDKNELHKRIIENEIEKKKHVDQDDEGDDDHESDNDYNDAM